MAVRRSIALLASLPLLFAACGEAKTSPAPVDAGAPAEDASAKPSALPQTCARGTKKADDRRACNGDPALCDRTYDKVVVPMTHNAMSNTDEGWAPPNQTHGLARQLEDGIRGMMLDVHYYSLEDNQNRTAHDPALSTVDQVYLCHSVCALGKARLLDSLCAITRFLDEHPSEVLTIVFENYVTDADTAEVLRASGLADYAFTHTLGQPWPTLRAMIDAGKRLVVFVEKGGGAPAYLHPAYGGELWDTPYSFETKEAFVCTRGRGAANSPLYLINHWLSRPLSSITYAREVNVDAVLGARVAQCTKEAARGPTFVAVDFYDVGDLFPVVRRANGL